MRPIKTDTSRRQFLIGAGGATLALPFLPSLATALGQTSTAAPKRFIAIGLEDGYIGTFFHSNQPRSSFERVGSYTLRAPLPQNISPILDSKFDSLRSSMLLARNVDGPFISDHNPWTFLAAQSFRDGWLPPADLRYDSIDRYIARTLYGQVQPFIDTLHINVNYYSANGTGPGMSTRIDSTGSAILADAFGTPQGVWDYVFGRLPADAQEAAQQQQNKRLIVDQVYESYKKILSDKRLSNEDKIRLSLHMEEVSELQKRVQAVQTQVCSLPQRPSVTYGFDAPANWIPATQVLFDLVIHALKCDLTRVVTFKLAPNTLLRGIPPFTSGHHDISHDSTMYETFVDIDRLYFEQIQYFVSRLDSEGLLDSSLVLVGNEIGSQTGVNYGTREAPLLDYNHSSYDLMSLIFTKLANVNTGYTYWFELGPQRSGRWNLDQGVTYNDWLVTVMASLGVPPSAYEKQGVPGYGDYRGDQWSLLNTGVISPLSRRGKPLEGLLRSA